jgi:hypothetical protein
MASAAIRAGSPPVCSEIPVAAAVTNFGADDTGTILGAPNAVAIANLALIGVVEQATKATAIAGRCSAPAANCDKAPRRPPPSLVPAGNARIAPR